MNRREAIEKTALALGYAISAPALAGILKGCKSAPDLNFKPVFFNEDQSRLVSEVAEIILPKTSTPGAKEVGVPGFIDVMLKEVYPKKEQDRFLRGLSELDEEAKKLFDNSFIKCEAAQQVELVKKYHDASLKEQDEKPFILMAKELTLLGFFTSEAGATKVLQYNPVPGPYQGCVPLEQVGKTWAT